MTYEQWIKERVSIDPEIKGGTPCFKGSRLPVCSMGGRIMNGETLENIVEDYPYLSVQDIAYSVVYTMQTRAFQPLKAKREDRWVLLTTRSIQSNPIWRIHREIRSGALDPEKVTFWIDNDKAGLRCSLPEDAEEEWESYSAYLGELGVSGRMAPVEALIHALELLGIPARSLKKKEGEMPKYLVYVPVHLEVYMEVEANSEDEAILKTENHPVNLETLRSGKAVGFSGSSPWRLCVGGDAEIWESAYALSEEDF